MDTFLKFLISAPFVTMMCRALLSFALSSGLCITLSNLGFFSRLKFFTVESEVCATASSHRGINDLFHTVVFLWSRL